MTRIINSGVAVALVMWGAYILAAMPNRPFSPIEWVVAAVAVFSDMALASIYARRAIGW